MVDGADKDKIISPRHSLHNGRDMLILCYLYWKKSRVQKAPDGLPGSCSKFLIYVNTIPGGIFLTLSSFKLLEVEIEFLSSILE